MAELVEPSFGVCDTGGVQRKPSKAAVTAYDDQSGVAQDLEVTGDGRSADVERLGQRTSSLIAMAQLAEYVPSGRICQRLKRQVK